jgi:hypothetical protein
MKAINITSARTRTRRATRLTQLIAGSMLAIVTAAAAVGITQAATHSMQTHGSQGSYSDCLALASRDGFAPETCEPLRPGSDIATIDCKNDPTLRHTDPSYCKEN